MKSMFLVQYLHGGKWRKTYFGNQCMEGYDIFYFDNMKEALEEIERTHDWQKNKQKKKKLTTYRIVEQPYYQTIHTL